jgi:hypothetical protein
MGKNIVCWIKDRPLKTYEDVAAAFLESITLDGVLDVLLRGYIVIATGDFYKYATSTSVQRLPKEDLLAVFRHIDRALYDQTIKRIVTQAAAAQPCTPTEAEQRLCDASQHVLEVQGGSSEVGFMARGLLFTQAGEAHRHVT